MIGGFISAIATHQDLGKRLKMYETVISSLVSLPVGFLLNEIWHKWSHKIRVELSPIENAFRSVEGTGFTLTVYNRNHREEIPPFHVCVVYTGEFTDPSLNRMTGNGPSLDFFDSKISGPLLPHQKREFQIFLTRLHSNHPDLQSVVQNTCAKCKTDDWVLRLILSESDEYCLYENRELGKAIVNRVLKNVDNLADVAANKSFTRKE